MSAICTATTAREKLYHLIDEVSLSHEPITITGKRNNAVLISEDDYRAVQETLYLVSLPGMREKIRAGGATSLDECLSYEQVLQELDQK